MRLYGIFDSELDTIAESSVRFTIFTSFAAALVTLAIGISVSVLTASDLDSSDIGFLLVILAILTSVSAIVSFLAVRERRHQAKQIKRIRDESQTRA
jgi:flagellar biosynthesis protein FliQ